MNTITRTLTALAAIAAATVGGTIIADTGSLIPPASSATLANGYVPLQAPCRIADTRPVEPSIDDRPALDNITTLTPGLQQQVNASQWVGNGCYITARATALQITVHVIDTAGPTCIVTWARPEDEEPQACNVNAVPSPNPVDAQNTWTVPITADNWFWIESRHAETNVAIDVNGYYLPVGS